MSKTLNQLARIHQNLRACRQCPNVCDRAVHGVALETKVMLIGQAPGVHEGQRGRPFAHTAGKTLFKWLGQATGAGEDELRDLIYFSAVARCFPGKASRGQGDRVPSREEVQNCRVHLRAEIEALRPTLILAVGKLAIAEVLGALKISATTPLDQLVGQKFRTKFHGHPVDVLPLPHPSGVSRWPHTEIGKARLDGAIKLLAQELRKRL